MEPRTEFWELADDDDKGVVRMLASETDPISPPALGALINIRSVDYTVIRIDHSIDRAGESLQCYRTNVYVRRLGD